jgi:hypothetical protein
LGKTYTAPDGTTFRPSLFITLTCPSYGRVDHRGVPVDPARYAYDQAARDALTFAALFDRFIQNLRRYLGTEVQYFAAVEPQRRLAPHVHIALRGTIARSELRRVLAATYHQVWWPGGGLAWTGSGCMICGTGARRCCLRRAFRIGSLWRCSGMRRSASR